LFAGAAAAAALAGRYQRGRAQIETAATAEVVRRLSNIGEVDSLSVLPLVERLVAHEGLRGVPGVCYLLRAGQINVLFDCGLAPGRGVAPLTVNAKQLEVNGADLSAVVISHLHLDHVGGPKAQLWHTFTVPDSLQLPDRVPAYVPTSMSHPRADVTVTTAPRIIAPGVAVLPPLGRMLFWPGAIAEQALMVNVRGFGLVLISGRGHPRIETVLAAAEQALDVPVRAVFGGLHLPVHPLGTDLLPQAVLGNPHWPWQPIDEADAYGTIDAINGLGPSLVALSSHDSTDWTFEAFHATLGSRYRTLRVGEPLLIHADSTRSARVYSANGN
jgi:7,8-dihydropterin-6-yl-methyl-4-(beta-D-ribofuranosyl)aminobenzene 5'-phosphate synthase